MLLQTNSYIVPPEKKAEHARLMRRFRQALHRVGCDNFEVYEQVGQNWGGASNTGRFVQIMRFRDLKHQQAVQNAERTDPDAQALIAEFCALIDYPMQQAQRQFVVGFYNSAFPVGPSRVEEDTPLQEAPAEQAASEEAIAQEAPAEKAPIEKQTESFEQQTEEQPIDSESTEEVLSTPDSDEVELSQTEANHAPDDLQEENSPADEILPSEDSDALSEGELLTGEDELIEDHPTDQPAEESEIHDAPSEELQARADEEPPVDADLEEDLSIGDDDISRLAEELSAEDSELTDPRHPNPALHGRNRASGNGDH